MKPAHVHKEISPSIYRHSIHLEDENIIQKPGLGTMPALRTCKETATSQGENLPESNRHQRENELVPMLKRSIQLQSENFIIKLSFLVQKSPKLSNRAAN